MGQGGYLFCEWDSAAKSDPDFQNAFKELDLRIQAKCLGDWSPTGVKKFGGFVTGDNEYGRTTIMPEMFISQQLATMAYWRQYINGVGSQMLIAGRGSGHTIPEDFKIAWIGLAFPNKQQQITELKWQIGDRKYGRINIEEIQSYNKPALIFEEGFIIDEEQSFDLYGYVEQMDYQRIVMLGAAYYKIVDKVLGTPGAAIT